MIELIVFALIFFLPAGVANVTPIFLAKMPFFSKFDQPLDFNRTFRNERIFGDHKTIRGMVGGVLAGTIVSWLIWPFAKDILSQHVMLDGYNSLIGGFLLGSGALWGDAFKSFFKRQFNIGSGEKWFPFDQLDYIIGGLIAISGHVSLSLEQMIYVTALWFLIHIISTSVGYMLSLKSAPL